MDTHYRRCALPVLLCAGLISGCTSLSPYVFSPCLEASDGCSSKVGLAQQWEAEELDAKKGRARYLEQVKELSQVTPAVGRFMLGAGLLGLLRGVNSAGSGDIPRLAIAGAGAYGYGALTASPPREQVYIAGAEALSCTLAATQSWGRSIGDLGTPSDGADQATLYGRWFAFSAAKAELEASQTALKPLTLPVTLAAAPAARCPAPRPVCTALAADADAIAVRRYQNCPAEQAAWDKACASRATASTQQPSAEVTTLSDRMEAELANARATENLATALIKLLEQAPGKLHAQSALIQMAVAKEVQKTAPDLSAVAAVVALVRRDAIPAPAPGASAPPSPAQSKEAAVRSLSLADQAIVRSAKADLAAAEAARLPLLRMAEAIRERTAGADAALALCSLRVPGVSLDVIPPDPSFVVKPSGKLLFEVSGGTGVPAASALAGTVEGKLVDGRLRFEYTAPKDPQAQPDTITFRDGARQARHLVRVTVQ